VETPPLSHESVVRSWWRPGLVTLTQLDTVGCVAVDATTELVPQPTGRDLQKVLASQLSLADVGEGAAVGPATPDRTYRSNGDLWNDVLEERVRANRIVHLEEFALSEWFPLTPGLFHTQEALSSREEAQHYVIDDFAGPDRLARLEHEIGRPVSSGALERATQGMLRVYSPHGKLGMMGGGVGCVRLNPRRLDPDYVWFMSASSTRRAHEGFPVMVAAGLYDRFIDALAERGGLTCRLTGRLHVVPEAFDPLFRRVVGVPRVYLLAEQIEPRPGDRDQPFLATGAVTFEAPWSDEPEGWGSEWEPARGLHGAYVTFAPGRPSSVREAVEWLAETYVEGLFDGRVVTDFDELVPRFADAPFALARLSASALEPRAVNRVVRKTNPPEDVSELFAQRAERLSSDARDFFISYTAADRRWAEWIAWRLEEAGYTTVLQDWDFRPGRDWVHEMQTAIAHARRTISVLSGDYLQSVHGEAEWRAAYAEDPTGEAGRLLPVLVRECSPPGLLSTRIWLDLVSLDEERARTALLAGVDHRRAKPSRLPTYPGVEQAPMFPV
jgi:hypothetical protein